MPPDNVPLNFQLTKEEWQQVFTICNKRSETAKFSLCMPFAFSEQGVAMLSSILKSERAIYVNIQMIRIFTKMRLMLTNTAETRWKLKK